jgi:hypothetical protein
MAWKQHALYSIYIHMCGNCPLFQINYLCMPKGLMWMIPIWNSYFLKRNLEDPPFLAYFPSFKDKSRLMRLPCLLCVCVCVCVRARACLRVGTHACVCACVCVCVRAPHKLLNHLTDFYITWCEHYVVGGHPNPSNHNRARVLESFCMTMDCMTWVWCLAVVLRKMFSLCKVYIYIKNLKHMTTLHKFSLALSLTGITYCDWILIQFI